MSGPFGGTHWMTSSKETIDWGGYRGVFAGGTSGNGNVAAGNTDSIGYVNLGAANADASDFGDLAATTKGAASSSNNTRAVAIAGNTGSDINVSLKLKVVGCGFISSFFSHIH